MKKLLCIILLAAMALSLASCAASGSMNSDGVNREIYDGDPSISFSEGSSPKKGITVQSSTVYSREATQDGGSWIGYQSSGLTPEIYGGLDAKSAAPEFYPQFIEKNFIITSDESVSTFSADVDTASYTLFRKLVNNGYKLQNIKEYYGASLRTEEMVNYFDYDYILPNANDLFGVKTVISECPWNAGHYLLTIGLATEDEAPEVKGNNLVFLIDVSGSMYSDDKLPLLKRTFSRLAENMTENDRISIVTYSGREDVLLEACPGNQYDTIMNAINRLQAQGSTNGQAGLTKAYDIATSCYIEGGNNRIIMASDGDLNVGISTAEELTDYISEKRESGIYLSVLGFGDGNYRDANMEALADNGNGVYYYIDSDGEAEKVFGKKLTSTLYTVANDVKIQITFDASKVEEYRLVGYENRILNKEDFENDTKDAGELGSGHTVTVCYELVLKDGALASDANIAKFAARWKKPGASVSNLQACNIKTSAYTKTPDQDFIFISAVIQTSMILRSSQFISKDADIADIIGTLKSLELADKDKLQFIDLLEKMK